MAALISDRDAFGGVRLKGGARCCVSTCFEKGRDGVGSAVKKRNLFAGTVTPLVAQITACFSMAGSCALRPRYARSLTKGARMTTGQDRARRPRDERKAGHLEISCTPSAPALQGAAAGGAPTSVGSQLGQRIRALREKLFLTQEQVAERAKISVSYLSMIENAQRTPYLETLLAISNALGITVSQLFAGLNAPRADIGQAPELPLMAYLGILRLDRKELDALLKVAKAMFDRKP